MQIVLDGVLVFLITAIWDYIWQQMVKGNIYICIQKNSVLCPNEYKWVRTGVSYFQEHSPISAMVIAGISGVYALLIMRFISSYLALSSVNAKQVLNCLFSSWFVGVIMRSSPDPLNSYLFASARKHYYRPLGFWWSSFTDAQSGLIVAIVFNLLQCIKKL